MFQFLRRVSASLLPRPDRAWREDATSHAPTITIGRKRRFSDAEQDDDDYNPSIAKRAKGDHVTLGAGCDSASERDSPKGDAVPPTEGQDVKEVTKGVKEVDLQDKDKGEDVSTMTRPEGVPLPDSPCGSPQPESDSIEPTTAVVEEKANDEEQADDNDSVASSSGQHEEGEVEVDGGSKSEVEPVATAEAPTDEIAPSGQLTAAVESAFDETADTLEAKA